MSDLSQRLISDDPEERRRAVAQIVEEVTQDRVFLFIRALGDGDWRVRKEAVGIARSFEGDRAIIAALVDVFKPGDNVGLRNAAVEALGCLGTQAVEALSAALPHLDVDGRKLAAEALARSGDAAALAALETLLHDDDRNVRAAAIESIALIGSTDIERAAPVLERCLVTDDPLTALAALEGLNRLGVAVSWPLLRPLLKNPVLRDATLAAAGISGHADAALPLARSLVGATDATFRRSLSALGTFIGSGTAAQKAVRGALGSVDEATRRRVLDTARTTDDLDLHRMAVLVAGALGSTEAAEVVIDALGDDRVAAEGEYALRMLGPAAILALARRARSGNSHDRAACVEQLGQLADASTQVIACQAIRDAAEDGTPEVVRAALGALAQIGDEQALWLAARWLVPRAPPAVRQTAAMALASAAPRHADAARALSQQIRPDAADAGVGAVIIGALSEPVFGSVIEDVAFLAEAASNESPSVRRAALDALSHFSGSTAVEAVSFALTDEAPEVRLSAIRTLGRMRDEAGRAVGVPHLLEAVHSFPEDVLGIAAIEALGESGDSAGIEVLRAIAREGSAVRAAAAVEAIGRLDVPHRIDALLHALSHPEPEVVKAALRAVAGEEKDPRAAPHVAACLDHETWDVRRLAAELLGRRGDVSAKHLLRQRLMSEREPLVREEIHRSLAETEGTPVRRTVPPIGGGMG